MSWGANITVTPGEGWEENNVNGVNTPEHELQYKAAKEAAASVLNTGALGGPTKKYSITISGHGNPEHEPVPGWSNDFVQISIVQVIEKEVKE